MAIKYTRIEKSLNLKKNLDFVIRLQEASNKGPLSNMLNKAK